MRLSDLQVNISENKLVMSWYADDRHLQLSYTGSDALPGAADAALASCMLPAMLLGETLEVDDTFSISSTLRQNLNEFQRIFVSWFDDVQLIDIVIADNQFRQIPLTSSDAAVFFSGGVDASYSFFQLEPEIDHLIFCLGLDIQLHELARCQKALEGANKFAQHYGKNLIVIESNFRTAFNNLSARRCQIVLLITYSLALGLETLYVPASHDAKELEPFRSHPLTDPLLSNGATKVVHHGMISRVEKTISIAQSDQALAFLRVCNASDQFNCGECEKCLRTMATLAVIGKHSESLPPLDNVAKLRSVKIWTPGKYHMWHDIKHYAQLHRSEPIANAVSKLCRAYEWKQLFKQVKHQCRLLLDDILPRITK